MGDGPYSVQQHPFSSVPRMWEENSSSPLKLVTTMWIPIAPRSKPSSPNPQPSPHSDMEKPHIWSCPEWGTHIWRAATQGRQTVVDFAQPGTSHCWIEQRRCGHRLIYQHHLPRPDWDTVQMALFNLLTLHWDIKEKAGRLMAVVSLMTK